MKVLFALLLAASASWLLAVGAAAGSVLRRKSRLALLAALALVAGIGLAGRAGYVVWHKAKGRVAHALKPRTGDEIYRALFGPALPGCLHVLQYQDQIVPRLDCCIWLEFTACPAEIKRILANDTAFRAVNQAVPALLPDTAHYSPTPAWWRPGKLGRAALRRQKFRPSNPNRDQILIFSPDSTHAYYCDMAD
ncbi:MAG: hypothetical protein ACRYF0_20510 [Janthinobacterium lividum]